MCCEVSKCLDCLSYFSYSDEPNLQIIMIAVHPVKPENQAEDDGDVANEKLKIKNTDVATLKNDYLLAMR